MSKDAELYEALGLNAYGVEMARDIMGGRNCARITVPIISVDQIRQAGTVLSLTGSGLLDVANSDMPLFGQILRARNLVGRASLTLKGGAAFRGAR